MCVCLTVVSVSEYDDVSVAISLEYGDFLIFVCKYLIWSPPSIWNWEWKKSTRIGRPSDNGQASKQSKACTSHSSFVYIFTCQVSFEEQQNSFFLWITIALLCSDLSFSVYSNFVDTQSSEKKTTTDNQYCLFMSIMFHDFGIFFSICFETFCLNRIFFRWSVFSKSIKGALRFLLL